MDHPEIIRNRTLESAASEVRVKNKREHVKLVLLDLVRRYSGYKWENCSNEANQLRKIEHAFEKMKKIKKGHLCIGAMEK